MTNGLINETESEDAEYYDDYSNMENNEDFDNHNKQVSKLVNNQLSRPNDHKINNDFGNKINKKSHNMNHKIHQSNHLRNGQSHQLENELSLLQGNSFIQQLNQDKPHPMTDQPIHTQNSLFNQPNENQLTQQQNGQLHHLLTNQINSELNQAINNPHGTMNHLVTNQFAQPNIQPHQSLNNHVKNQFSQQQNSLLHQTLNHQTENQFNQQINQLNELMNQFKGNQHNVQLHPTENKFTQNQKENGQLNHPMNQLTGNNLNQAVNHLSEHQNDHTNQPMNWFSNSVSSQFSHQLNEPQNKLIDHILRLLTDYQNLMEKPNNPIQMESNQQTTQNNQLLNPLFQLDMQKNDPDSAAHQQNSRIKKLMNLLPLSQFQQEQNNPPSKLSKQSIQPESNQQSQQQNTQTSLPAIQPIHSASPHLIKQENNKNFQFVNSASNQLPQQQSIQIYEPATYISHPTSTSPTQQGAQTIQLRNKVSNIASDLLSRIQNDKTNQPEAEIHTENSHIMPQKNYQIRQPRYQSEHITSNQPTQPQNLRSTRPMSHLIHTANNQIIHHKKDQSKIPTDVIIHSVSNYISNKDDERDIKIKNKLMQFEQNQVTDQKTDQTNQYINKLIHPTINEMSNSQKGTNQQMDNDQFHETKNKATSLALNNSTHQSIQLMGILPENQNQSIHQNNNKFAYPDKNLLPHTTDNIIVDHEPSQYKDEIKTSTNFMTKHLIRNITSVSIHTPFVSKNYTDILFPE